MLYQKLLAGNKPYFISERTEDDIPFGEHCHPEVELTYCVEGTCDNICDGRRYTLRAGDLLVIPPMAAHAFPASATAFHCIVVELGPTLLGDHFDLFIRLNNSCRLFRQEEFAEISAYASLAALLEETAALQRSDEDFSELFIHGNLYRAGARLLQLLHSSASAGNPDKRNLELKNVDNALKAIYIRYYEPLDIESISAECGYSKSNFCKIFKNVTGDTFHNTLNRHRVEIACMLLREGSRSVEDIAQETGFADMKSFCRVFKRHMGESAGEYRKRYR